jgi:predicted transcriptional regulator
MLVVDILGVSPTVQAILDHLRQRPLTVYELADTTGKDILDLDDTLRYMEDLGMVTFYDGYWVANTQRCPNPTTGTSADPPTRS